MQASTFSRSFHLHIQPQLSFARDNGIDIHFGNPDDEIAGQSIILPSSPELIKAREVDLNKLRHSLIRNKTEGFDSINDADIRFLAEETKTDENYVKTVLKELGKI